MVRDLLKNAAQNLSQSESPMLDARVLLAAAMKKSDAALIFEYPKEEELALFNEYIKKDHLVFFYSSTLLCSA